MLSEKIIRAGRRPTHTANLVPVVGCVIPASGQEAGPLVVPDEGTVAFKQALVVVDRAKAMVVRNDAEAEDAAAIIKEIKSRKTRWLELVEPLVKSAAENHKKAVALRDSLAKPLDEAERLIKARVGDFLAEQERQRREAEAAAQAEAQRQAEAEQAAQVEALEAAGQQEEAQAVAAAPVQAPIVIAAPVAKPAGVSTVETWHYQIVDSGKLPREYMMPDEKKIGQVVRAMKGQTNIAGVKVYCTNEVRTRA